MGSVRVRIILLQTNSGGSGGLNSKADICQPSACVDVRWRHEEMGTRDELIPPAIISPPCQQTAQCELRPSGRATHS